MLQINFINSNTSSCFLAKREGKDIAAKALTTVQTRKKIVYMKT